MDIRGRATCGDEGWTWGEHIGSTQWLTVLGSYHTAPYLRSTREEAQADLNAWLTSHADTSPWVSPTVACVRMVAHGGVSGGTAFRVLH